MANQRGEFILLELESKALSALDESWRAYDLLPEKPGVPTKLIEATVEVHKMVMQRMNAKYGLDGSQVNLSNVRDALLKEVELVNQMIAQEQLELQ